MPDFLKSNQNQLAVYLQLCNVISVNVGIKNAAAYAAFQMGTHPVVNRSTYRKDWWHCRREAVSFTRMSFGFPAVAFVPSQTTEKLISRGAIEFNLQFNVNICTSST